MANHNFDDDANAWRSSHTWDRNEFEVSKLLIRINILEERLKRIEPTQEQMDKYPSLKDAYEQLIIIKKLITENDK